MADVIGNSWDTGGHTLPWGDAVFELNPGSDANCASKGQSSVLSSSLVYYADNRFNGGDTPCGRNAASRLQISRQDPSDIVPYSSSLVEVNVLANAGAYNGLSQGLDAFDARRVADAASGAGGSPMTSAIYPDDFPAIRDGAPYVDDDGDGMADDWERLDPTDPGDGATVRDADGYTHLEAFLYDLRR